MHASRDFPQAAEGDTTIPTELYTKLDMLFCKMDIDNDQSITKEEATTRGLRYLFTNGLEVFVWIRGRLRRSFRVV